MPVYLVIEAVITDREKYRKYLVSFSDVACNYGGRCLVQGGRMTNLQDELRLDRRQSRPMAIFEFASEVDLRKCLSSREYQSVVPLKEACADTRTFLLDGFR